MHPDSQQKRNKFYPWGRFKPIIAFKTKVWSLHPLPRRNPAWASGMTPCSSAHFDSLPVRHWVKHFTMVFRRAIGLCLLMSSVSMDLGIIFKITSPHSSGISQVRRNSLKISIKQSRPVSLKFFQTSFGIASTPGALPSFSRDNTVLTSARVEGSFRAGKVTSG